MNTQKIVTAKFSHNFGYLYLLASSQKLREARYIREFYQKSKFATLDVASPATHRIMFPMQKFATSSVAIDRTAFTKIKQTLFFYSPGLFREEASLGDYTLDIFEIPSVIAKVLN